MPLLFQQPRHAKPRDVPAAKAILVPLVLAGSTGSAFGGLAMSASASEQPTAVSAAAVSTSREESEQVLLERAQQSEQRASRQRAAAAEQAAAAEAARIAAEKAAAAKATATKAAEETAAADKAATTFSRPGTGRLTSGYGPRWGRMHRGIDLAAGTGSPIRAAAAGTVISAGLEGGYGRAVRIRHADGSETLYAHNSRLLVSAGQRVVAGEQIAREGATGNVTGPHLHFEVRIGGDNVNPLSWLRRHGAPV